MSTIACPGCGGRFPLAQVAAYETFTCSSCGHVVMVPVAPPTAVPIVQPVAAPPPRQPRQPARPTPPPAARRTAPATRPAAAESASRPAAAAARPAAAAAKPQTRRTAPPAAARPDTAGRTAGARRGRRDAREDDDQKPERPLALYVGGGLVLVAAIAVVAVLSSGPDRGGSTDTTGDATDDTAADTTDGTATAGAATETDTWRALSDGERQAEIDRMIVHANGGGAAVDEAAQFFREHGEKQALERLARLVLGRDPKTPWANDLLGREEVTAQIRLVLRKCELADEVEVPPVLRLRAMLREREDQKEWWVDGDELRGIKQLLADVEVAEQELSSSEAALGRARWIAYQRTIEVIKDYPTLNGYVGPYLLFVQVEAPPGTAVEDADPEAVARAQALLDRNIELFRNFYEGWMTQLAPSFGFTRYDENTVTHETIMKANVFANAESYQKYNVSIGMGRTAASARAYYSKREPRFICTYDGTPANAAESDDVETPEYVNHVQCHEATHQLVHFYTWDTTRKATGREPPWLDAITRPLWSTEGFAEFFSSYTEKAGKYTWMQPLVQRMKEIWIFHEIVKEKGWKPWTLDQLLSIRNGTELQTLAGARANSRDDFGIATGIMANLFYGEAWSLNYFLWYGNGAKYRPKVIDYFKHEFEMDYGQSKGGELARSPRLITEKTFEQSFGIDDAGLTALFDEWKAWETKFLAENKDATWDAERTKIRKRFGLDK